MSEKGNQKNLSKRHHFLPRFYLKGFTNSEGFFHVYDKNKKKILAPAKSPKQFFFEWNRNITILPNGQPSDSIEQLYSALDNRFSDLFAQLKIDSNFRDYDIIIELLIFVNFMKWRIPAGDNEVEYLSKKLKFEDIKINIKQKSGGNISSEEKKYFESLDAFKFVQRTSIPFLPFYNQHSVLNSVLNHKFYVRNNGMQIIGDNPIIEFNESPDYNKMPEFIFAINNDVTSILVRENNKNALGQFFYLQRDLAMIHIADRFVASSNRRHLEKSIEVYNIILQEGKEDKIVNMLYEYMKRKTN